MRRILTTCPLLAWPHAACHARKTTRETGPCVGDYSDISLKHQGMKVHSKEA
jgi:hypothetical protein